MVTWLLVKLNLFHVQAPNYVVGLSIKFSSEKAERKVEGKGAFNSGRQITLFAASGEESKRVSYFSLDQLLTNINALTITR